MLEDFHDCNYRERLELIKKLLKDFTAFGWKFRASIYYLRAEGMAAGH